MKCRVHSFPGGLVVRTHKLGASYFVNEGPYLRITRSCAAKLMVAMRKRLRELNDQMEREANS